MTVQSSYFRNIRAWVHGPILRPPSPGKSKNASLATETTDPTDVPSCRHPRSGQWENPTMPCPNDTTQTGATSGLRTTISVIVAQALAILIVFDERRRQRCALNRLNDRLLNDI